MNKLYKVFSLLLLVSILLAACTTTTPTPQKVVETQVVTKVETRVETQMVTKVVEKPAERSTIRLSGWASSPEETVLLQGLLLDFTIANPDIVVKYEPITGDYWATLKTAIASGTEPDVFYMDIFQVPAFVKDDVLLPLDDLMAAEKINPKDFIPSLMSAFTANGKIYGIPKDFNTLGLFYNKEMFKAAGLAEPTDDWTWTDLEKAAAKLSNPDKKIYGFGVPPDAGRFPVFIFQNGGSVMTPDYKDTLLDSPEAIDAAKFYTDFVTKKIGAIPADLGEGWQGTLFGKGQLGMVYEGGWLIPYLTKQFPDTKYGVVTPPAGPKGEGNLIFTVSWSVSKNTKNPKAAMRLMNFLTNEASQVKVLNSGLALPSRTSLANSEYLKKNADSAAIFRGASAGARPFVWGVVGSDVNDQMGKALERVYREKQPVADAMKVAAKTIRQKIAEAK